MIKIAIVEDEIEYQELFESYVKRYAEKRAFSHKTAGVLCRVWINSFIFGAYI